MFKDRFRFLLLFLVVLFLVTSYITVQAFSNTKGELKVAFLDVGQGDSIYIESPSGVQVLIDGGKGKTVLRELGAVMPFSDRSIDIVLATHPDQDHIGGLPFVFDTYEVGYVIRSGFVAKTEIFSAFNQSINKEGAQELVAKRGMVVDLGGGVHLDILYPEHGASESDANDASVVARLVFGESEVLLMGDAPQWVERFVLSRDGDNLESDILKVGHHGSKTSTANAFVAVVDPEFAVLSYGEDNRYGHPHKEVISTLDMFDIKKRHTSEGRIVCRTDGLAWDCN